MERNKRINYLDGLKGIACMMVFFHHFCLAFFPAIHYGEEAPSYLNNFDTYLSQSSLSFLLNGNYFVVLFCMISGFIISRQVMCLKDKGKLANIVLKRYFRLMIPVIPVGILVYLLLHFDIFTNLQAAELTQSQWLGQYYIEDISLVRAVKSMLIDIWFYGDGKLSNAFWMLSELFYGTFLAIVLSTISWKKNKFTGVVYVLVAICCYNKYMQMAFALGVLLAWISLEKSKLYNRYVGMVAVMAGLFLGAYPSGVEPTNVYRYLSWRSYGFWHTIGAFLLLYGIFSCESLQKFLSSNVFRKLGMISYSVYLIHIPLLFSVSTALFMMLHMKLDYVISVIITGVVSVVILLLLAKLYHEIIEKRGALLSLKMMKVFVDI